MGIRDTCLICRQPATPRCRCTLRQQLLYRLALAAPEEAWVDGEIVHSIRVRVLIHGLLCELMGDTVEVAAGKRLDINRMAWARTIDATRSLPTVLYVDALLAERDLICEAIAGE